MNTMMHRGRVKLLRLSFAVPALLILTGCGSQQSGTSTSAQPATSVAASHQGATFTDWGPKSMVVGTIPNAQPDGGMGLWINVSNKSDLGVYTVLFDGKPMSMVGGNDHSITASVPASLLASVGAKEVIIRRHSDGKVFVVGTFHVTAVAPTGSASK